MSIKISELPSANSIGDNDIFPIVQSGTTKKIVYSNLKPTIETTIDSSSTNDNGVSPKAVYDYSAPINHASSNTTYGQGSETNYGHCKTINGLTSASYVAGESLSAYQGKVLKDLVDTKQDISNLTTTIDENSTDVEYPSAKAVYDELVERDARIEELEQENEQLLDQIPTDTATGETITVNDSANLPLANFEMIGNATQDDTPTPETPQAIHVVTGDVQVNVIGKNFINNTDTTYDYTNSSGTPTITTIDTGLRFALTTSGTSTYFVVFKSIDLNNYIGKIVRLKATFGTNGGVRLGICNSTCTSRTQKVATTTSGEEISFTVTNDMGEQHYLTYILSKSNGNVTTSLDFTNLILTIDESDMTYEPYQAQTVTLPLGDIKLAGIPNTDYKDRIFKAQIGTPSNPTFYDSLPAEIKATLTLGKWYVWKNIGRHDYTGTEVINDISGCFQQNGTITNYGALRYGSQTNIMSEYYVYNSTHTGITGVLQNGELGVNTGDKITIKDSRFQNASAFTTWLATQYANGTPFYILFAITPTTTEITDTALINALEAIKNASTYKNVTNFSIEPSETNATGDLQVTYYKDLETMFSNLNNAILSLGNNT